MAHTFWNAGDTPCRILEIISPGGFDHYFEDLADGVRSVDDNQRVYGTHIDMEATLCLCQEHGLSFPSVPD